MRNRELDAFRGLSILLMVFFSLIARLSYKLPDFLNHNAPGSLHLGDFVLPMFLFASGMSLVFFAKKREGKKRLEYVLDIIERFGKLAGIGLLLSPFSASGFFEMDEVMLSALLFVPSVILLRYSEKVIGVAAALVFASYFVLQNFGMLPDFPAHYLGGYQAAIFYLPVMLGGVIAGKLVANRQGIFRFLAVSVLVSAVLILLIPPYKMSTAPSFMALSVAFSLVIFEGIKHIRSELLEYLGRKPLRYWTLMFMVLIVPITFYAVGSRSTFPLGYNGMDAAILALLALPFLYLVSKGLDKVFEFRQKLRAAKRDVS